MGLETMNERDYNGQQNDASEEWVRAATVTATYVRHGRRWRVLIRPLIGRRLSRVVDTQIEAVELVRHFNRLGLAGVDIAETLAAAHREPKAAYGPLHTAAEAFLDDQQTLGNMRTSTVMAYRRRLARWAWPLIGQTPWNVVTREDVAGVVLAIRRAGKTIATIDQVRNPLTKFYQWQQQLHGYKGANPAADLKFVIGREAQRQRRRRQGNFQWFRYEEAQRLLAACRALQPRWYAFLMVSFGAGTRWGEAAALERNDIDWRHGRLHIRRTWSDPAKKIEPCKDGESRWVKVSASVRDALGEHLEKMKLEASVRQWSAVPRELVFPTKAGRIVRYQTFHERVWQPLMRATELRYRTPHAMRHTYATWMLEAGADLRWVRDQLGHASIRETEETYGHLERDRHEARVDLDIVLASVPEWEKASGRGPARPPASTGPQNLSEVSENSDELGDADHLRMAPDHPLEGPGHAARVGRGAGQRRAEIEHLTLERPLLESALGEHEDIVHLEGLGQVVVGPALERLDGGPELAHGGGDDDDRRRIGGLDAREDVDPRLAGHPLVEHDQVDLVSLQDLEGLSAVRGFQDVAGLFEDRADRGAHAFLVVHDEDRAPRRRLRVHGGYRWRARSMVRYWLAPPLLPPARWT